MGVSVELRLPWGVFPLSEALGEQSGRTVTVEPIVPTAETPIPYVWVHGAAGTDHEAVFDGDAPIDDVEVIEKNDGSVLYRLSWEPAGSGFVAALRETEASVVSARADADEWLCTVRFKNHSRVSEFKRLCDRADVSVSLRSIDHGIEDSVPGGPLTPAQRETLQLAVQKGYFSIPRGTTLSDLAEELGVSDQATSERIRRGVQALLVRRLDTYEVVEQ
jgi:predicted DNA binding protein